MRCLAQSVVLLALSVTRSFAANDCARPTDPGGFDGYDYGAATVRSFGDAAVLVWYAIDGEHAVNTASTRLDGVPADVAAALQVTSDALASYAAMGYRAPVPDSTNPTCGSGGGDGRLDVYLVHMVGADGMTVAEPGRCTSSGVTAACAAFTLAQSNFAGYYATSDIGIHTVLPHEAFHTVQDAYDANLDRFWAEGTAQWAAKALAPSLTDLERFLPAFFSPTGRSLDAPPNGVTSAFLYGAAIWPVFLTARHGDGIVRAILEQQGQEGGPALTATDVVLRSMQSSMALEYPLFAAWNVGTGARAGSGGYPDAAKYPMVAVTELDGGSARGITAGFASFYFHVKVDAPVTVALTTNATRNAGTLVPLVSGVAHIDEAAALPAELDGEGIIVVSGITSSKSDAPFTVTLTAITDGGQGAAMEPGAGRSSSGCSVAPHAGSPSGSLVVILALLAMARRRRSVEGHRFPRIGSSDGARATAATSGVDRCPLRGLSH